jgi:hypothetical protein
LDRSDVDYEAEPSEVVLVAFSLVDDFGLSDVFDCSDFLGAALLGFDLLA